MKLSSLRGKVDPVLN